MTSMAAQQTSQIYPNNAWIVDSGASHHMTADVSSLSQVAPLESNEKITIGQEDKGGPVSSKE